jgi:Ca2+-binding EF-hand superfamily protein
MKFGEAAAWAAALALFAPWPALSQDTSQDGEPGMGAPREGFNHLTEGEPRQGPGEALRRDRFDETIERMFASADTDRNGTLTLAELRAVIEARKADAIRARFAAIDTDRNQSLSYAEFDGWQRGLGSVVLSNEGAAAASNTIVAEDIGPEPMRGPGGQVLARLVAPLNATMLAAANTDMDGGATLAEIAAYEGRRFDTADANKDGWVTEEELRDYAPRR